MAGPHSISSRATPDHRPACVTGDVAGQSEASNDIPCEDNLMIRHLLVTSVAVVAGLAAPMPNPVSPDFNGKRPMPPPTPSSSRA
ncbi:MAG: hypothetical protein Ct9H300mP1_35360 [Planctomycetaceae bacterium]|nr:MAG: hypothetical protein Ct9H300mP1_35360 [Planctomycetaceae bacterium]